MSLPLQDERLLDRREVESYFGVTKRFLEVAAVRGNGPPFIKIGRSVRYRVSDIRTWIEEQKFSSTSQVNR